jgi:hypothetical protein
MVGKIRPAATLRQWGHGQPLANLPMKIFAEPEEMAKYARV